MPWPWGTLALASIIRDVRVIGGYVYAKRMDKNPTPQWGLGTKNAVVAEENSRRAVLMC